MICCVSRGRVYLRRVVVPDFKAIVDHAVIVPVKETANVCCWDESAGSEFLAPKAITSPPLINTVPSASKPPLASVRELVVITLPPLIVRDPLQSIPSPCASIINVPLLIVIRLTPSLFALRPSSTACTDIFQPSIVIFISVAIPSW